MKRLSKRQQKFCGVGAVFGIGIGAFLILIEWWVLGACFLGIGQILAIEVWIWPAEWEKKADAL